MASEGVVMETREPNATLHAYLADFTINDAQLSPLTSTSGKGIRGDIRKSKCGGIRRMDRHSMGKDQPDWKRPVEPLSCGSTNGGSQGLPGGSGFARFRLRASGSWSFPGKKRWPARDDDVENGILSLGRSLADEDSISPSPREKRRPAPKKEWACMRFWLEAKKLNAGLFRLVRGYLVAATSELEAVVSEDSSFYAWSFSLKGGGVSIPDPRFVGDLKTTPSAPIFYDPKLI